MPERSAPVAYAVDLPCGARLLAIVGDRSSRKSRGRPMGVALMPTSLAAAGSTADLIGRHRRNHFVDPRSIAADRFEFRTQLGLGHAARSDDLQILLIPVEV